MRRLIPKFKWMLLSFTAIFIAAASVPQVLAQDRSLPHSWSIDILEELSETYFTVGSEFLMPTAAFSVRYATNPSFDIQDSFAGNSLKGTGEKVWDQNYNTQTISVSLQPMFTVIQDDNVNFHLYGGVGVLKNNGTASMESPWGTGTRFAGEEYDAIQTNYGLGSETRFLLPRHDFMMQSERNYVIASQMDGYDFEAASHINSVGQSEEDTFLAAMAGLTVKFGSGQSSQATWYKNPSNDRNIKPVAENIKYSEKRSAGKVDNYYVISAAFQSMDRAKEALKQLQDRGFKDAGILPQMHGLSSFNYVAFTEGITADESQKLLNNKYISLNGKAWVLQYDGKSVTE